MEITGTLPSQAQLTMETTSLPFTIGSKDQWQISGYPDSGDGFGQNSLQKDVKITKKNGCPAIK